MGTRKILNMKKCLLLGFMCICWFLPRIYVIIDLFSLKEKIQASVIILAFFATTLFYYICKNAIFRLSVTLAVLAGLAVVINYKYMMTVAVAFAVIYIYKSSITENDKNENINQILLAFVPCMAIVGIIINFKTLISSKSQFAVILLIFVISFLILMISSNSKNIEKKSKKTYINIFSISIIGVLASASTYNLTQNTAIAFFPWFFFIMLLVYENDEILYIASKMVISKIKTFVE